MKFSKKSLENSCFQKKILLVGLLGMFIFLVSCSVPAEKVCTEDSDCITAQCCHADDAVNKDHAPDCSGTLCTMNCEPDTIDCGQGSIKCVSGSCEAVMNE